MEKEIKNTEDKVWVTISRTINLGNYENLKIDAGMSQTIGINDPLDLLDKVCDDVQLIVSQKAKEYKHELMKPKRKFKDND